MRNTLLTSIFVLAAGVAAAQSKAIAQTPAPPAKEEKNTYQLTGAPLPPLKLVTFDTLAKKLTGRELKKANKKNRQRWGYEPVTNIITEQDLSAKHNTFLMIFNPNCGHCEDQTEYLEKNIDQLKDTRVILVGNKLVVQYMGDFIKNLKLNDYSPTLSIAIDSADYINQTFLYSALPQINIYSPEHKLLKVFSGGAMMDSLAAYVK